VRFRFADFVLPTAIISTPIVAAIITIFGRPTVVLDAFYNRVWKDDARSGLVAAVIVAALLVMVLTLSALRNKVEEINIGQSLLSQNYLLVIFFVALISVVSNFTSWGLFGVAKVLLFFWTVFVLTRSGITVSSFKLTSALVFLSYILALVFPILSSANSWKTCREDKCSIAGSLLTSFFQSENALSLYVLTTVYFLKYLERRWQRLTGYTLALVLTYLSGSRLGLIVVVIVVALLVLRKTQLLTPAPLVLSGISLAFFLFTSGADLTGRGSIFRAVREIWLANPILGVGPNATQLAFERGMVIGFIPYNEQTQIAHLLAHYGLIAAVLFLGIVLALLRSRAQISNSESLKALVTPFLITSLAFATESPLSFTIDCPSFWVLAILFARIGPVDKQNPGQWIEGDDQSAKPYKRSPASPKPGTM